MKSVLALLPCFLAARTYAQDTEARKISDPSSYVLPFIGTTNGGHVFPGATLPHGMVKAGMDTDSPGNHAGYDADPQYRAIGFSQLHDDGTGGGVPLSNFKIWPFAQCASFNQCTTSLESRAVLRKVLPDGTPDDVASPGYFASNLTTSVRVELTATRRTALHRYTFPAGTTTPRISLDMHNDGQRSGSGVTLTIDPKTGQMQGGASFIGSFGPGSYPAFTCVSFKGQGYTLGAPTEYGIWTDDSPKNGTTDISQVDHYDWQQVGGMVGFKPAGKNQKSTILVRVGVSLISAQQACSNAQSEIPDFDFEKVRTSARSQWNDLLGRIQVDTTGVPKETVQLFYSSLYRTHISPADYSGENPLWQSSEPYFDSLYCNWDTYRTLYPLMSLHDPVTLANIVRGMIDIQKNEGWLPECRGATVKQAIQGGSDGDPILAEFFVKFSEHAQELGISSDELYEALRVDAEEQPPNWDYQGRQVNVWKQLGYVPHDSTEGGGTNTRQASRTLEYAFNDFTISQVAKILGKAADADKYAKRSGNFINIWNPNTTVPDAPQIVGMMQPKRANGTFDYTDPRHCSIHDPEHATCYLDANNHDGFYEGSPIIYSQYVPHDTAKLIQLQGGVDKFVQRLDWIFQESYFESTNEPSQQMPFMYHYANKPGYSTQRSRQTIAQYFTTAVNGLPGNDDSGAMGSYAAFYLAGLYPLPATKQFLLSSPYFKEISFFNPLYKKTTIIRSKNFNGNPSNGVGGRVFVQSVTVNGQPYKSNCYLDWDIFTTGAVVELTLTDNINVTCGNGAGAIPPSLSTGGYN